MSAGSLGQELLSEVEEERLDEFLHRLRLLEAPQSQYKVGIPALDDLIALFHPFKHAPKTIQQSSTWPTQSYPTTAPSKLLSNPGPPVIELAGATACSGKTQLLCHITALKLLPSRHNNVSLHGEEAAVVLFDLSSTFPILRLNSIMQAHITARCRAADKDTTDLSEIQAIIHSSLQHLHIYRPQSLPALLSALSSLETYLLATPAAHTSAPRPLGLAALSNISAFFWPARLEAEEAAFNVDPGAAYVQSSDQLLDQYRSLVSSLRTLQRTTDCPILATNMTLSAPVYSSEGARVRPHMPAVWNNLVTVKVVLQREKVPNFGPEISVKEAEGERDMRWAAVEKAGRKGWIDWWGGERWRESEREGVRKWRGLKFWVHDDGVAFAREDM